MRKNKEELEKIKQQYNVQDLYSWSKYNTYKTNHYEYFLKYILKQKEDRNDSIYGTSGGISHEIIESFYNKEIDHEGMLEKYEEELFNFNIAELKYDRCDKDKNDAIAKKYESCLKHFFINHQKIPHKLKLEQFLVVKVGKFIFQCYIDAIHSEVRNGVKKIIITDWKTSSLYTGKKIEKERGQLVLYSEAVRQKLNIPLENIIARWNFLKYIEVEYTQAKGDKKTRIIERNSIVEKLKSNILMWLKKEGLNEIEIEDIMEQSIKENSLECLPQSIKDKFVLRDCYVEIPLDEDVINDLKEDIIKTIVEIKSKELEYEKTKDDNLFWEDITDESSYFFAVLSGYSRRLHKPYDEYLKSKELFKNKDNDDEQENEDLSWMDQL